MKQGDTNHSACNQSAQWVALGTKGAGGLCMYSNRAVGDMPWGCDLFWIKIAIERVKIKVRGGAGTSRQKEWPKRGQSQDAIPFENYNICYGQIKERIHKQIFETQPAFCVTGKIYIPSIKESFFLSFFSDYFFTLLDLKAESFPFSWTCTGIGKYTLKECNLGLSAYMEMSSWQSCLYGYMLKN